MKEPTLKEYIDQLGSSNPTPGGGSAAAYVSAVSFSLARMSINVSKKRKSFQTLPAEEQERIEKAIQWIEKLEGECFKIQESDTLAFDNYMKIYKSGSKEEIENAAFLCYNVPFKLLEINFKAMELMVFIKPYIISTIISDYKMALELCCANIKCCLINMDININNIKDEDVIKECQESHKIAENAIKRIQTLLGEI